MPILSVLGSFPNSQIRPRNAALDEDTQNITVPDGVVTTIAAANSNRTNLNILNEGVGAIRWRTADEGAPTATDGYLLKAGASVEIRSREEVLAIAIGADAEISTKEGVG